MLIAGVALALAALLVVPRFGQTPEISPPTHAELSPIQVRESDRNKPFLPARFTAVSESQGRLRLSGLGEAGTVVSILNEGQPVRQVRVNDDGEWNVSVDIVPDQIMDLSLILFLESGIKIRSEEVVFRVPLPRIGLDIDNWNMPQALVMVTTPGGPSRILQSPFGGSPTKGPLTLGPIDYDDRGGVVFSGTSDVSGRVRIYINGNVIGDREVDLDGRWRIFRADTFNVGQYEVIVELNPLEGDPVRLTVPFERLSPRLAQSEQDTYVKFEALRWQLRRGLMGGGGQYSVVFAPEGTDPLPVPSHPDALVHTETP